jgi:sugar phosphate isomerase/epimerase
VSLSLHTGVFRNTGVLADVAAARGAGFDGVELQIAKLEDYLRSGGSVGDIRSRVGTLRITMLDALVSVERTDAPFVAALRTRCARLAQVAKQLDCPFLQVVALDDFLSSERADMRRQLRESLGELAAIAIAHNVRLALEPVCFSPFHALDDAVDLVGDIGRDRIGLVLDTWHLWVSGTSWTKVADLDPSVIACVHIGDSEPRGGARWSDQDRAALPGEGIVPLAEAIAAIKNTRFDGTWAVEAFGDRFNDWEPATLARSLSAGASRCLGLAPAKD